MRYLRLGRLHTAGWQGFTFVLGPLLVGKPLLSGRVIVLWWLGVIVTAFVFTLNNLVDLPRDRRDPARQNSPLVAGEIAPEQALLLSVLLPLGLLAIVATQEWDVAAQLSFIAALGLGAFLNVYQKSPQLGHPLLMDSLFGVAMAAPVPVGVLAVSGVVDIKVWLVTLGLWALFVSMNCVGGNLKGLEADRHAGFSTVALRLGVSSRPDGTVACPLAYRSLIWVVLSIHPAAYLGLAFLAASARGTGVAITVGTVALLAWGLGVVPLQALFKGARKVSPSGREPFLVGGMTGLLVACLPHLRPADLAVALGASLAWEGIFRFGELRPKLLTADRLRAERASAGLLRRRASR